MQLTHITWLDLKVHSNIHHVTINHAEAMSTKLEDLSAREDFKQLN